MKYFSPRFRCRDGVDTVRRRSVKADVIVGDSMKCPGDQDATRERLMTLPR